MNDAIIQSQLTHLYNEQFAVYRQMRAAQEASNLDAVAELELEALRIWEGRNRLVILQVECDRWAAVAEVERMLNL